MSNDKNYSLGLSLGIGVGEGEIQRQFPLDFVVTFLRGMLRLEEC